MRLELRRPLNSAMLTLLLQRFWMQTSLMPFGVSLIAAGLTGACTPKSLPVPLSAPFASEATAGLVTLAPLDYVRFCIHQPAECRFDVPNAIVPLTAGSLAALDRVNRDVNRRIKPKRDVTEWRIDPPSGNCNDYVVTKRHKLIGMGLPASAILIATAKTPQGDGHLLLVVRTDRGELILDNLTAEILYRHQTDYTWIKRQSSHDPVVWERL